MYTGRVRFIQAAQKSDLSVTEGAEPSSEQDSVNLRQRLKRFAEEAELARILGAPGNRARG